MNTRKICPQCFRSSQYYKHVKGRLTQFCAYCHCNILKYQVSKALATRRTNRISRERALRSASVIGGIQTMSTVAGAMCLFWFFMPQSITYTAVASSTEEIQAVEGLQKPLGEILPIGGDESHVCDTKDVKKGYGGCIVPHLYDRPLESLSKDERVELRKAQEQREGSTLSNNPFGIKYGGATKHWVTEGKATLGSKALDGGVFLNFKDKETANQAYEELLYDSRVYRGLTVHEAMRVWTGHGNEV